MGRFVLHFTKGTYNHVSVSLGGDALYSFARIRESSAFYGGFVEESPLRYRGAAIKVLALPVSAAVYAVLCGALRAMREQKEAYIYNTLSALFVPLKRRIPIEHAFTCAEFAGDLLASVGLLARRDYYAISDFETEFSDFVAFEGTAERYWNFSDLSWLRDDYPLPLPAYAAYWHIGKNYCILLKRLLLGRHDRAQIPEQTTTKSV